jgi:hypothetical protein
MNNENSEQIVEVEYSAEYINNMQKEGLFDAMNNEPPQFPLDRFYMEAYTSVKR